MAKGIFDKAIEQSLMIFVREGARKAAKGLLGRAEEVVKRHSDKKKAKKRSDTDIDDKEDTIE
jgi:hypothetical protein